MNKKQKTVLAVVFAAGVFFALAFLLLSTFYILHSRVASAQTFQGPSSAAGTGVGAIGVAPGGNLSIGTSTPQSDTKLLIVGTSTSAGYFAIKVVDAQKGPLFIIRSDGSVSIGSAAIPSNQTGSTTTIPGIGNQPTNGALFVNGPIFNSFGVMTQALSVGTTTPQSQGNVLITGNLSVAGSMTGAGTNASNISGGVFSSGGTTSNFAFPLSLGIGTSSQVGLPQALSVYGEGYFTGNVGIGTTSLTGRLVVSGATNNFVDATVVNGIDIMTPTGAAQQIYTDYWGTGAAQSLILGSYNYRANQLVLSNGGNVGIGTSTPSQKLDVNGTIYSETGGIMFPDGTTQTTAASAGATPHIQTFTSSGTWTHPAGVNEAWVTLCGGGGGGGNGYYSSQTYYAGGGGGGGQCFFNYPVAVSANVTVTVGAAGAAGYPAANGGTSSFGAFISANGGYGAGTNSYDGNGGGGSINNNSGYCSSGATYGSNGFGGQGGPGCPASTDAMGSSGGGGGSGWQGMGMDGGGSGAMSGGTATTYTGGGGGASSFGAGGNGVVNGNGSNGGGYGGGGAGGAPGGYVGGNGAPGVVIVQWYQ